MGCACTTGPTPLVEAMLFAYIQARTTLFEGDALDKGSTSARIRSQKSSACAFCG
jgi:hypothetical protein